MRRALSSILIAMMLGWSGPVHAGDLQKGLEAAEAGDYATALREFRDLAENGDPDGQLFLGLMYRKGWGVAQDYAEAVKWYRLAAAQGHAMAQSNLAAMYQLGWGVAQDYAEAVKWIRLAAEQGHAMSQSNLGMMYARGLGVSKDIVIGQMWLNISAASGNPLGATEIDENAKQMTPDQIAEAKKLAREWMEKHPRQ